MTTATVDVDQYVGQWWFWFAVALLLLLPIDLLTTLVAVAEYGTIIEANPVMAWLLDHGLLAVTVANLLVGGLVVYMFHAAIGRFRRSPPSFQRPMIHMMNVWIGILLGVGIAVVTTNLRVFV